MPRRVLIALVLASFAAYLAVALARMSYPFELEWIEGGLLQTMRRVVEGKALYVAPSLDYIAFNYPPLYPWLSALVARLAGDGFLPLRLVSFASSLGAFALVGLLVGTETRDRLAGWLAAGLFAATFHAGGGWFDIARADSLHLLLVLAAFLVLRRGTGLVSAGWSGILFTLAFLAKQSAAMIALPIVAWMLWRERGRGLALAGALALGIGGTTLALQRASGGWYAWYLFYVPRHHPMDPHAALAFWPKDIIQPFAIALLIGAGYFWAHGFGGEPGETARPGRGFFLAMAIGMAGNAWFQRMYPGGYANVLMPVHAAIAILFGLGWHALARASQRWTPGTRARAGAALTAACVLQWLALSYDPLAMIPRAADRAAGERLVAQLRATQGQPLVPSAPYLLRLAGKPDHFHEMAFVAVEENGKGDVERRLKEDLERAIRERRYSLVLLHTRGWLGTTVSEGYAPKLNAFPDPSSFWPVTGMHTRPEYVWLPRPISAGTGP